MDRCVVTKIVSWETTPVPSLVPPGAREADTHREVTASSKGHLSPTFIPEDKSGDGFVPGVFSLLILILVRTVFPL